MVRHRRAVVAIWVLALVLLGVGAVSQHSVLRDVFTVPGTNSQSATERPRAAVPRAATAAGDDRHRRRPGLDPHHPRHRGRRRRDARRRRQAGRCRVGHQPVHAADAASRRTGASRSRPSPTRARTRICRSTRSRTSTAAAKPVEATGVQVEFGGSVTDIQNAGSNDFADLIGILAGLIILFILFRTLLAAVLPIGVAIFGVAIAGSLLLLIATQVTIGTVAPILGSMIGLGVGIDYSLLVLSRYLQNRDEGMAHEAGVAHAIGTAGAASLFAGCCVAIALCGLAIAGIPYVAMLGYSAGLFVAVMVLAALTLLPAVLGMAGPRITRKHKNVEAAEEVGGMWYRFAHVVSRHAVLCVISSLILLAILAAPILDLQLGFTDDGNAPTSETQRKAYDLVTEGFGEGANGPLIVAISVPDGDRRRSGDRRRRRRAPRRRAREGARGRVGDPADPEPGEERGGRARDAGPGPERGVHATARARSAPRRHPGRHQGDAAGRPGVRRRRDRRVDRRDRPHLRSSDLLHRRRGARRVPAADGGVPLDPRAAQGRDHEPAVDRCRVRRHRRGVPVGLGAVAHRPGRGRADRGVRAADDVRDPLRSVDGLRGLPALTHPRGVPPHRRLTRVGGHRRGQDRTCHHRGRARS